MALSISVVYVPPGTLQVPAYQITVSGLTGVAGGTNYTIWRQEGTGAFNAIRGAHSVTITANSATVSDFEYSYQAVSTVAGGANNGWSYFCNVQDNLGNILGVIGYPAFDGTQSRTDVQTLNPYATAVFQSIQQPALSLPVVMQNFDSWDIPGRVLGTYPVLGRANPVVLTDVSGGRTGTFTILFDNDFVLDYTHQMLKTLLGFNDTFLLQPFFQAEGVDDLFFRVTDIVPTRNSPAYSTDLQPMGMAYAIAFTEVDRPLTVGVGTNIVTWQNVLDQFAGLTWNDVLTHRTSWLDVLNQGNNPP